MTAIADGEYPGSPRRKHRHDLGQEDHGPALAASVTRAIQILLGLWIAASLVALAVALAGSVRPPGPAPGEAPAAGGAQHSVR